MLDNRNIHRFRSLDVCFEIFLKEHAAKILFELLSRVVRNSGSIKASNNSFVPSRRTGKQRTSIDCVGSYPLPSRYVFICTSGLLSHLPRIIE